ncbi:hypothetical protein GF360_02215 [candidate division WWE3 bacterium]|nr:hypothetical protein [candidate division WWE3 bacterium]
MPINLLDDQTKIVNDWRKDNHAIKKYSFLHLVLPHPEEKRRAKLLSSKALSIYTLILVLIFGAFKFIPRVAPGVLGYASNIHVQNLLKETNKIRAESGLAPLKMNNALSRAAQAKAKDMFEDNYWAHVAPDGTQPWDFILQAGYDYSFAGENLAKNFNESSEVVRAWYDSPSHRENLLSANYDEIGFAVVNGVLDGYETTLVVQTFGRQRTPTYLSSASNEPVETIEESVPAEAPGETQGLQEVSTDLEQMAPNEDTEVILLEESKPTATIDLPGGLPEEDITLPAIDITAASQFINIGFVGFLGSLLVVDIWYSKRKGIRKISGHALAHILFLIFAFVGMWFALSPGKIL